MKNNCLKNECLFVDKPLLLECGKQLGPITVAYETFGKLNSLKNNVILICHSLTGDSHVTRHFDEDRPGWWEEVVGPGKTIDTNQFFVVCSNVLGGCSGTTGPSSVNPKTGLPWGMTFPAITIRDMVRVQSALLDNLGIDKLLCVVGGSLGGAQTIEWAVTYPERMKSVIPICSGSRFHPQGIAIVRAMRQAIMLDPKFQRGNYYLGSGPTDGLALAREIIVTFCRSDESYWQQFGRKVRPKHLITRSDSSWDDGYGKTYESNSNQIRGENDYTENEIRRGLDIVYEIESYLDYNGKKLVERFDANSFIYITRAVDFHDVSRHFRTFKEAHATIKAKTLVIGVPTDIAWPPFLQKEMVETINEVGGQAEYIELESSWGHDAFLTEFGKIGDRVKEFLISIASGGTP